jgi:thioredoxin 1
MAEIKIEYGPSLERSEVDELDGSVVLIFGTNWCGFCQGAAGDIAEALGEFPNVKHIAVEDGPGRSLGRSFRVKLWPTLIFLKDGQEIARRVRPADTGEIREALVQIA